MENKVQNAAIKIKNSSNVTIRNSEFRGFDTGIDAENTDKLIVDNNFMYGEPQKIIAKLKWYKDPKIVVPAIVTVLTTIALIYFKT